MRIHIAGIVQGVGMRPFVYREAAAYGVTGWVLNAGDGVHIEAHGENAALEAFVMGLSEHAPAAARIDQIQVQELSAAADKLGHSATSEQVGDTAPSLGRGDVKPESFRIIASEGDTAHTTLVSPDIATCDDCLHELFDPSDHRYHYPFINCTNCGPRFTIIRDLPYDRARTSMNAFPMCPECASEYADPLDRRFHAQPDACFECGPHITWRESGEAEMRAGDSRATSDAIIERCTELLANGGVVAIKGLGGFHLACRAGSEEAVHELRHRKRRSNKPLAVMVRDLASAEALCHIGAVERNVLTGSIRPIVLLKRHVIAAQPKMAQRSAQGTHNPWDLSSSPNAHPSTHLNLAHSVAFDLPELGVMLPYTPLQHLLLAACAERGVNALVMTSGNPSGAPIETDDESAWSHLVEGGLADALMGNNREILSRFDDSVVRVVDGRVQLVRRARGYAPQPIALPAVPVNPARDLCVLACGPEQKATLALTRETPGDGASCFISQHIGNLENAETMDAWHAARKRSETLFDLQPTALVCDAHPGYLSSQWAREQARLTGTPLVEVQHHHAHIASVIAEAAAHGEHDPNEPVVGIALDGTGAGANFDSEGNLELDGTIWGGEILIASLQGFKRVAHLKPWPLPGGAASIRDPRRNALALLHSYGLLNHPGAQALLNSMAPEEQSLTLQMLDRNINCPLTSSMGRLLDAISAILGICTHATYEGEPAIRLEAAANQTVPLGGHVLCEKVVNFANSALSECNRSAVIRPEAALQTAAANPRPVNPQDSMDPSLPRGRNSLLSAPSEPCPQRTTGKINHIPVKSLEGKHVLDVRPILNCLLDDLSNGVPMQRIALNAHCSIHRLISDSAIEAARASGIYTVALSGGVFMNRLLLERIQSHLSAAGLTVLLPHDLPFNDGCIAYGQAAVARACLARRQ